MLSLIDAHEVFLIDICKPGDYFHQDLVISTSEDLVKESLFQSALEFVLHNPQSLFQASFVKDEFGNDYMQLLLEKEEFKLICNNYEIKDYSNTYKEAFSRFLSAKDITPSQEAIQVFPEFLGDSELLEDKSRIEKVTVEKDGLFTTHQLKRPSTLTTFTLSLLELVKKSSGSLFFKVNTYPYFEIQYLDKTSTCIWLNTHNQKDSQFIHELIEL